MAVGLELSGRLAPVPEQLHEGSEQVPDIPEAEALAVIAVQQEKDPAGEEDERAGLLDESEGSKEVSSTGGTDAIDFKTLLRVRRFCTSIPQTVLFPMDLDDRKEQWQATVRFYTGSAVLKDHLKPSSSLNNPQAHNSDSQWPFSPCKAYCYEREV